MNLLVSHPHRRAPRRIDFSTGPASSGDVLVSGVRSHCGGLRGRDMGTYWEMSEWGWVFEWVPVVGGSSFVPVANTALAS
jgi:hypothetical protein